MTRGRTIWYAYWPFTLLCVLAASRWLVEGARPETSSTLSSQALGCAGAGVVGIVAVIGRRRALPGTRQNQRRLSTQVGACLVLVGPVMAETLGGRRFGADPATLALALVPVVAAVASSASEEAEAGNLPGLLWPGLAGLAGLLLLLPQPSFSAWRPWSGLLSLPLLVGIGGWMAVRPGMARTEGQVTPRRVGTPGGLLLAAGVFGAFWFVSRGRSGGVASAGACCLDGLSASLTLIALRRMGVRPWSAQFLLVPLLGLLEGMVFLRPVLDLRSWLGLGLIAVGGAYQLLLSDSNTVALPTLARTGRCT